MFTCVCVVDVGQISMYVYCVLACVHVAEVGNSTDSLPSHQEGSDHLQLTRLQLHCPRKQSMHS